MGNAGVYKYNPETKQVEKVSDRTHKKSDVFFPRDCDHSGHFFENLNTHVRSKEHKREVMKKMGVAEL